MHKVNQFLLKLINQYINMVHEDLDVDQYQILYGVLDINGTILYASPSCENVLGYATEDITNISVLEIIHSEDVESVSCKLSDIIKTRETGSVGFRYKHAQYGFIDAEAHAIPMFDEHGEIQHLIAVAWCPFENKKGITA